MLTSGYAINPQSWNRYVYTVNNPTNLSDPLGLFVWNASLGGGATDAELNKTSEGRKIVERRDEIRNALNNAADEAMRGALAGRISSAQAGAIFDSLAAYGSEGSDNGVSVGFGNVEDGDAQTSWETDAQGSVTPFSTDADGNVTALVVVTFESGKINARNAVHEGSHTRDRQLLADALEDPTKASTPMENRSENISKYETERRAYLTSSYTDQAMNSPSTVWQRGSREDDRRRSIDSHIRTVNNVSPLGTNPGPGGRLYQLAQPRR